jgi:hypothetical protein
MTLLRFRASVSVAPPYAETDRSLELDVFQADLALIRAVSRDVRGLADCGRRLPVTLAVRHTSLSSGNQQTQLHQALAALPVELRKFITVEICFPPGESWTYACKAFLERTRPLGLGWSALVDLERPQAILQVGAWLRSVGASLSSDTRTESESLRLMATFGARTRELGLECAAYGLASRSLVLGAIGAGFRFLSGPAIHADVSSPAKAVRFNPLDLYRDLVGHGPMVGLSR